MARAYTVLTCRNHSELRWMVETSAINADAKPGENAEYDGSAEIEFLGHNNTELKNVPECECVAATLIVAPEEEQEDDEVSDGDKESEELEATDGFQEFGQRFVDADKVTLPEEKK